MNTHDAILELDNLTLGYDRHPAIHHLRCRIARGALVAIVGPNGAGKSTLFKALTGELQPLQGHFRVNAGKEGIAYLPQQSELDRSFPVSVFDMVSMGLWREIGAFRGLSRSQAERVRTALAAVGLSGFEARQIGTLSGGQLQRARFARMMLQDANLLLLDEPFNAIDARTIEDLVALILQWHAEGRTILAVLHDLTLVRHHFPETLLLARECVGFGPTDEILTPEHLATARRLAGEFDATAPVCHRPEAEAA
ncbi:zinc ABC transporter ATP-binding protein AztA [Aromatoleum toluclasticum]|uniref:zinc ABC transporter ATP-binding protein AztA n=1 Tax=Aromatoleum toluclasticum TaxID=92003 RepID=UPI00036DF1A7|nr:zinc ABC transporter ATP-binding protein AztA [Aromatoleum toluclasticum]